MTDVVLSVSPRNLRTNPENPRLIFHEEELQELQASIAEQGILVPLTVYQKRGSTSTYTILDGERRWRCALSLDLPRVPIVVQPQPTKLQNIMMMFAIHKQRRPWDPLPTAYKLRDLEAEFERTQGRRPTEEQLAQLASMSRGEVRRLKILLGLPHAEQEMLMRELNKPRSVQRISADNMLEATRGAAALRKRDIISAGEETRLRRELISKFRDGVIQNTTDPRMLARIGRAVDRGELSKANARKVAVRLIESRSYSIRDAVASSVEQVDFEHGTEQLAQRLVNRLEEHLKRRYEVGASLAEPLARIQDLIKRILPR
ncbi:MAG: ParB/RepB/Spo0J family partition protein [Actinomycetota bacterium]